jgi:hypothetical protein
LSYLRFTPHDYRAIVYVCRYLDFIHEFLPHFKHYLVDTLALANPDLATRISKFRKSQASILFNHLKERKRAAQDGQVARGQAHPPYPFTFEEIKAVQEASDVFMLNDGSLASFQDFLVHEFQTTSPALAQKLNRLTDKQIGRLYQQVKEHKRWVV